MKKVLVPAVVAILGISASAFAAHQGTLTGFTNRDANSASVGTVTAAVEVMPYAVFKFDDVKLKVTNGNQIDMSAATGNWYVYTNTPVYVGISATGFQPDITQTPAGGPANNYDGGLERNPDVTLLNDSFEFWWNSADTRNASTSPATTYTKAINEDLSNYYDSLTGGNDHLAAKGELFRRSESGRWTTQWGIRLKSGAAITDSTKQWFDVLSAGNYKNTLTVTVQTLY